MAEAVLNKATLLERLRSSRNEIKSYGVKQLGLFGSFAHNTNVHRDSDIDLLVTFDPRQKTYDNYIELSYFLEGLLGRKVEIVTPESLSRHIGPYILKQVENVAL